MRLNEFERAWSSRVTKLNVLMRFFEVLAIWCVRDIYCSRRIRANTNNAKPPRGSWVTKLLSFCKWRKLHLRVALWMLAILRSRYSRDTRWSVRFLPLCFYSFRKVESHSWLPGKSPDPKTQSITFVLSVLKSLTVF